MKLEPLNLLSVGDDILYDVSVFLNQEPTYRVEDTSCI
jgi:hypothetical protein